MQQHKAGMWKWETMRGINAVNDGIRKQAGRTVEVNKMKFNRDKYKKCSLGAGQERNKTKQNSDYILDYYSKIFILSISI